MRLLLQKISLPLEGFPLEVDLEINGAVTAVFGPSGAGKTSLLDLVAGLRRAHSGVIQLGDQVLEDTGRRISVPVHRRGIGCVPQDLALFPHLSVRQNLLYGRKAGGRGGGEIAFDRVIETLEIQPLIERGIRDLSGGEKQRVALARALLASPRLLLLDEPLASLDRQLKTRIIPYLARIRDEFQVPMLYVTHDRWETLALADEMIVLVRGRVAQQGSVREVFNRPSNLAVAGLLTIETVEPGRILKTEGGLVTVAVGAMLLTAAAQDLPAGTEAVHVCIRAEDVIVLHQGGVPASARNHLACFVQSVTNDGPFMRVELDCGFTLTAQLTRQACEDLHLRPGDRVTALIKAPHIHLIPK